MRRMKWSNSPHSRLRLFMVLRKEVRPAIALPPRGCKSTANSHIEKRVAFPFRTGVSKQEFTSSSQVKKLDRLQMEHASSHQDAHAGFENRFHRKRHLFEPDGLYVEHSSLRKPKQLLLTADLSPSCNFCVNDSSRKRILFRRYSSDEPRSYPHSTTSDWTERVFIQ